MTVALQRRASSMKLDAERAIQWVPLRGLAGNYDAIPASTQAGLGHAAWAVTLAHLAGF